MRRIAPWALLLPALALAQVKAVSTAVGPNGAATQTANSAAGNVPTAATDGVSLYQQSGLRVVLSAASGQTLSGAGTLRFWFYDAALARWVRNQNVSFSVTTSGVRDAVFEDLLINVRGSGQRVYVEAVSVTSSSGALTVTVQTWR